MNGRLIASALRAQRSSAAALRLRVAQPSTFSLARRAMSNAHHQETFESFTERYVAFFQSVEDLFELQRGLNNCFAHDLVPAPAVIEAALRAARRVDDYSTAVRILEGVKEKVENKKQYEQYLDELKGITSELGECSVLFTFYFGMLVDRMFSARRRHEGAVVSAMNYVSLLPSFRCVSPHGREAGLCLFVFLFLLQICMQ